MYVAFQTLGCKVNSYETEAVWEMFQKNGYQRVSFHEYADVYIINTCMVTNTGEAKSRKMIRQPLQYNPDAIIVVMGCLTQLKAEEVLSIPGVKIVLGTKNRMQILSYLEEYKQKLVPLNKAEDFVSNETYEPLQIEDFVAHQRAFLKIQDGCNNFCTYCIIPFTRGRVRSKLPEQVLAEAKDLVDHGHVEVILTGIHTGGYGVDLPNYSFYQLLKDLCEVPGLKRIRISSIEITELTDEIIDLISTSKIIVPHLHIPLQSGSDTILKKMNRKYTLAEFQEKIIHIRTKIPQVSITTDIIVGFPSETEADFETTLAFVKTIGFDEIHVFGYSKRSGTVASKMKEEIDGITKKDRVNQLIQLSTTLAKQSIQNQIGTIHEVVVEQKKNGFYIGHTGNYIQVKFYGENVVIGSIRQVKITKESYPLSEAELI